MTISVITPTADQPRGMELLEVYVSRQTVQPREWIVVDDGTKHAELTLGQDHIKLPRVYEGGKSLANNLMTALAVAKGDAVIIMEHDDWYAPNHIEICARELEGFEATGCRIARYFNVAHKCWKIFPNHGSALCNTAFTKDAAAKMAHSARWAFDNGSISVDGRFWDSVKLANCHEIQTVVGIKGMPGRKGLGIGHRPNGTWNRDESFDKLREWIGNDTNFY